MPLLLGCCDRHDRGGSADRFDDHRAWWSGRQYVLLLLRRSVRLFHPTGPRLTRQRDPRPVKEAVAPPVRPTSAHGTALGVVWWT